MSILATHLNALGDSDAHSRALLHYEIGRRCLSVGNEVDGASHLLKCYALRPQFRPTLSLARQLYTRRADVSLVIKLLDAEVRATKDPISRAALLRQQSHILWLKAGDIQSAILIAEEAHRLDPTDIATFKLLNMLLRLDSGALKSSTLNQMIELLSDDQLKSALRVEIALSQPSVNQKIKGLTDAQKHSPEEKSLLYFLAHLQSRANDYRGQIRSFIALTSIQHLENPLRAEYHSRIGHLYQHINDIPSAHEHFLLSIKLKPTYYSAADAFESLIQNKSYEKATSIAQIYFDLEKDTSAKLRLAYRVASIYQNELDNPDSALRWHQRALDIQPSFLPALEDASSILQNKGDLSKLLDIYLADLLNSTTDKNINTRGLYRLAKVYQDLGNYEDAIDTHTRLLNQEFFPPSVIALEELYTTHKRWSALINLYQQQIDQEKDPTRIVHLLETIAAIWHYKLDNKEAALSAYKSILEYHPDDISTIQTTARYCEALDHHQELIALNEKEASLINDPQKKANLFQQNGTIHERIGTKRETVIEAYCKALDENPQYLPALQALGRLYREQKRWSDLIEMYRSEAAVTTEPLRTIKLYTNIAEIYIEELKAPSKAAEALEDALQRFPNDLGVITALSELYRQLRCWTDLADLLQTHIELISDRREKARILWQIATLHEEELDDAEIATDYYQQALRLDPDLVAPMIPLIHLFDSQSSNDPKAKRALLDHLGYQRDSTHSEFKLARAAELLEFSLKESAKAAQLHESIIEQSKTSLNSLWALKRIYKDSEKSKELVHAISRLQQTLRSERDKASLSLELGILKYYNDYDSPLSDLENASYNRVNQTLAQRISEDHSREKVSEESNIEHLLLERLQLQNDPFEQACIYTELGDRYFEAGATNAAERSLRKALEHMPSHLKAALSLAKLLEKQERWQEQAELTESIADKLESLTELSSALIQAADLWENKVHNPERAIPLYHRALQVVPDRMDAFDHLARLYEDQQDWQNLSTLIRNQISSTTDEAITVDMFRQLGELYLDKLDQTHKAEACFKRVLEISPFEPFSLLKLGDISLINNNFKMAEDFYSKAEAVLVDGQERQDLRIKLASICQEINAPQRMYAYLSRALEDEKSPSTDFLRQVAFAAKEADYPEAIVEVLERIVDQALTPFEKIEALKEIASITEERLDDPKRAEIALHQVLMLDPLEMEAIERLSALYGRSGNRNAIARHLIASVDHYRGAINERPFEKVLYRNLSRIFRWQRHFDHVYCACAILESLDEISNSEKRFMLSHEKNSISSLQLALTDHHLELLVDDLDLNRNGHQLLQQIMQILRKSFSERTSKRGLSRNNKLSDKSPVYKKIANLCQLLSLPETEIWVYGPDSNKIESTFFSAPALVIGGSVSARLSQKDHSDFFRLAFSLFSLHRDIYPFIDKSKKEIQVLFKLISRLKTNTAPPKEVDNIDISDKFFANITNLAGRKERRLISHAIEENAGLIDNLHNHIEKEKRVAYRIGLLAACSPRFALKEITEEEEIANIRQFIISKQYFTLREELGIKPKV